MHRSKQQKVLMRHYLRLLGIFLALIFSLISVFQSCSNNRALKDLSSRVEAMETQVVESPAPVSASPEPEKTSFTMSFVGDCTLGSDPIFGYNETFIQYYDVYGESYFFEDVRDIFSSDDLTIANLEGTFTTSNEEEDRTWNFKADPEYAGILTAGSVEIVSVSNNHSHDFGAAGHTDTLAALEAEGVGYFGYANTFLTEIEGVQIGFTGGYELQTEYPGMEICENQIMDNIQSLRDQGADLVVVTLHWGVENSYYPYPYQTEMAHRIIDAGADLIIGNHPHVLQGIEVYQGKYIVYSLGNFCFGGNGNPEDYDTAILQLTYPIGSGQITGDPELQLIPCSVSSQSNYNTYCPTPSTGEEADRIMDKIYELSAYLDGGITRDAE